MTDELYTIGQLARRTGLPVRTIRFWSDSDVLPPSGRSAGGYRLYDAAAVARLELVRTLRELGLGLDVVQQVLARQRTVAEVAAAHVRALDAEIRLLRLRRAVLASVAARNGTTEEMSLMHKLAQLSARERQELIDEYVDTTFDGVPPDSPGYGIAQGMRQLSLPDDPTPEQVDAWVELAELVTDADFRARTREMAVAGTQPRPVAQGDYDYGKLTTLAGAALADGVAPESARGQEIVREIAGDLDARARRALADEMALFSDARVERYWALLGTLNGWEPFTPKVPAFEWFIAALRA
ncbi:helix-turn-helix domain-containing protein [Catenuloplanes atrovinosus]|uniref:DNA-binding transcriptional MerR regulator n=1 Tax=Catenuloplanes atrovinosus TaxID=137266 RepID=A0AAE3YPJ8_9ACTN|nr:MerR family transcriptional regulator [Catenuloplanes atrovinosus]MDR7275964.1 DNA-binding transcriptional MerR regulator [Catenuloplanes atrovinosus]